MSNITLGSITAPSAGGFNLPANTLYNGVPLTSASAVTNPTVSVGTITAGGATTTSQTVTVLSGSLKPRLSTNGTVNTLRFQLSTTPSASPQNIQFALPGRTTAVSAVTDVAGPRPNARDANGNAVNDVIVGGVVAASGTPSGFVQFTANNTTAAHYIDVTIDYIS